MNVLDIAKKRYSVRTYEDKPVEKEKLEKILASAHVAPKVLQNLETYIMPHWQLLFVQTIQKHGHDLLITNRQQILTLLF